MIEDDEDDREYYKSLGFSIIIANPKAFLEYIENVSLDQGAINSKKKSDELISLLKGNLIPTSIKGQVVRPIDEFFIKHLITIQFTTPYLFQTSTL